MKKLKDISQLIDFPKKREREKIKKNYYDIYSLLLDFGIYKKEIDEIINWEDINLLEYIDDFNIAINDLFLSFNYFIHFYLRLKVDNLKVTKNLMIYYAKQTMKNISSIQEKTITSFNNLLSSNLKQKDKKGYVGLNQEDVKFFNNIYHNKDWKKLKDTRNFEEHNLSNLFEGNRIVKNEELKYTMVCSRSPLKDEQILNIIMKGLPFIKEISKYFSNRIIAQFIKPKDKGNKNET